MCCNLPDYMSAGNPNKHCCSLVLLHDALCFSICCPSVVQGFAVAFSAFTDIAPVMVIAIGLHNIPEGLICAAPFYAATGSKWKVRQKTLNRFVAAPKWLCPSVACHARWTCQLLKKCWHHLSWTALHTSFQTRPPAKQVRRPT